MSSSIQIPSYAKINWTLDVLFKREDGYHELRTIYQTVSLHDTLSITDTTGTTESIRILCDDPRVPCDETNLVFRAAVALRQGAGSSNGARIEIRKRIPVAAGLGGGSSNAAVTLLALTRLWQIDVSDGDLIKIAANLGSDVPFFLTGGTALGIGRGEEVYPTEQVNCEHLLLVNPRFAVSTPAAYASLSRLTRPEAPLNIHFTLLAAKGISDLPLVARNDLEEVVIATHQEIAEVKRRLVSLGARHTLMSGSGATVFGVFDNSQTTERAASMLHAGGYWAQRARTVDAREYQATIFQ